MNTGIRKNYGSKLAFKKEIVVHILQNETIVISLELFKRGNVFGTPGIKSRRFEDPADDQSIYLSLFKPENPCCQENP